MKTALLVIDYIDGIMDGPIGDYAKQYGVVEKTNKLVDKCKTREIAVFFVRLAFEGGYPSLPKHSKIFNRIKDNNKFILGSGDTEFIKQLNVEPKDTIINKSGVSPFCGNKLIDLLKDSGVEKLIFAGVSTDNAINLGAREAHDAGFYTVIASDACGAIDQETHDITLQLLDRVVNQIKSVDSIIA